MNPGFSLSQVQIGELPIAIQTGPRPHKRATRHFLRGPIDLAWIQEAARLPGAGLHVGIALWYRAGFQESKTVSLNLSRLKDFGVERDAGSRALKRLEAEALVSVVRAPGKMARVTLLVSNKPTLRNVTNESTNRYE